MKAEEFTRTIVDTLMKYSGKIYDGVAEAAKKRAKELQANIKKDAPKRNGFYSKSWRCKENKGEASGKISYIVENKRDYQLVHLLEDGHDIKRDGKVIGHAKAHPHFRDNEKKAIEAFENDVEELLQRGN